MRTLLIVDDIEDIRQVLAIFLSSLGYTVLTAATKDDMLRQMAVSTPDLIILDIRLGGQNGAELCRQLKMEHTELPIILTSASKELLSGYRSYYADGIIEKPFDLKTVRNAVSKVLPAVKKN